MALHIERYSNECFSIAYDKDDNFTSTPKNPVISYTVIQGDIVDLEFIGAGTFEQFSRLMDAAKLEIRNNDKSM